MGEFKHSWRFELSADADIWLLSQQTERLEEIRRVLEGRKFGNVVAIESVDDTFTALRCETPTILIIDAEDSPEEGIELLKDLRSNPRLPNIPVLPILTQRDWDKHGPTLHAYNVTQALIPPFHGDDIVAILSAQYLGFQKNSIERLVHDARTKFQAEDFESAGRLFSQARDVRKTMSTEVGLASTLVNEGKFAAAQKIVNEAKALDGDSFELQILGLGALLNLRLQSERSRALVKQAVKGLLSLCLYEERAFRVFCALAAKPDVAVVCYETFEAFGAFPQVVFEAAKCHFALARDEDSLALAKSAYEMGLRRIELLNLLGVLYKRRREPSHSLIFYTEALRLKPDDHRLHFNKGLCLEDMRKLQEAVGAYTECLSREPTFAKARERLDALAKEFRKGA